MTWEIREGDCVALMAAMPEASVDSIVCDPPYGLEFMGKAWDRYAPRDFQAWCEAWAREAFRVLKPGGHLLAFGGTRTYHRMAAGVEDAGFEIRDQLQWLYGSGFPKSLDVSKAIDKAAGAEREIVGVYESPEGTSGRSDGSGVECMAGKGIGGLNEITAPATPDAERWAGWGTALKPAHEPIVLARKPLTGTVAGNVLAHGTGALNVDGCRIGVSDDAYTRNHSGDRGHNGTRSIEARGATDLRPGGGEASDVGRWPANVVMDEQAAAMLDAQTGTLKSGLLEPHHADGGKSAGTLGAYAGAPGRESYGDSGGASRFLYVAKASTAERNAGLDGFEKKAAGVHDDDSYVWPTNGDGSPRGKKVEPRANVHPTVKPIELMRWLVRLVTPPGGLVLDPFTGSGTTGIAATLEGFRFVGLEQQGPKWVAEHEGDDDYIAIASARITWWQLHPEGLELVKALEADRTRRAVADTGQLGLL